MAFFFFSVAIVLIGLKARGVECSAGLAADSMTMATLVRLTLLGTPFLHLHFTRSPA